jgi:hypothetical protein
MIESIREVDDRIFLRQVGAQQVTSLAAAHLPQLGFAQPPRECLLVGLFILLGNTYGHQAPRTGPLLAGGAQLHQ